MQDFPPNSAKARARSEGPQPIERPKIERVTSAEAERRPRGLGSKFKETFFDGTGRMAVEYAMTDIVIPGIRDLVFDMLQGGLDRLIYGDSRRGARRGAPPPSSYSDTFRTNYQEISSGRRPPTSSSTRSLSRQSRARQNFDEIVIHSRPEAEEVLDRMYELLSRYGMVTVSDLYEMTGIASSHIDHRWGWIDLRGAKIVPQRRTGGYLIDLPDPEPLSS